MLKPCHKAISKLSLITSLLMHVILYPLTTSIVNILGYNMSNLNFVFYEKEYLFGLCSAAENRVYLSKTTVDSMVQQAFTNLNTVMSAPNPAQRRYLAIGYAKQVSRSLKDKAHNDPNEKYILFRVNELDAQIWLEEKDVLQQDVRKKQVVKNSCIDTFNMELGKKRPDFTILTQWVDRMGALDERKQDEMSHSLAQRKVNIGREVSYRIERAFISGDIASVRNEYVYCVNNKSYLPIPNTLYDKVSQKMKMYEDMMQKKPALVALIDAARQYTGKNQLREAHKSITDIRSFLEQMRKSLSLEDFALFDASCRSIQSVVAQKEDSLIAQTIALFNLQGDDAALSYIETNLKKAGVLESKIAQASNFILGKGIAQVKQDGTINSQVDALSDSPDLLSISMDDIRTKAKQKARARSDSVQTWGENTARNLIVVLYTLLEQDSIAGAYKKFKDNQDVLQKYVYQEVFGSLSTTIVSAYDSWRTQAVALKNEPVRLDNKIDNVNFAKAEKHIKIIYDLLEKGKIAEAYAHFSKFKNPLKVYSSQEAFDLIESTVNQSYEAINAPAVSVPN